MIFLTKLLYSNNFVLKTLACRFSVRFELSGLATFVHSKLSPHTKFVAADSNYLIVLCCGVLLINVYFPCVSTVWDYGTLLCDICTAIGHVIDLNPDMPVVLGGDMNFNFTDSDKGFMIF